MTIYSLLLTSSYEPIRFLPERRVIKLLFSNRVESISDWDNVNITWTSGKIKHPSIIRLINDYRKIFSATKFNRSALIKRDKKTCQYCGEKLFLNQITIDHIVPLSKGGTDSFNNCVIACKPCNYHKADLDLDKCGLKLIRKPENPGNSPIYSLPLSNKMWHKNWDDYI